jgi:hypothetical protein
MCCVEALHAYSCLHAAGTRTSGRQHVCMINRLSAIVAPPDCQQCLCRLLLLLLLFMSFC